MSNIQLAQPETFWLTLSVIAVALMWIPHILQLIVQEGPLRAIYDPAREVAHHAAWAQRARRAHANAVENIAVFAPLTLLVLLTDNTSAATAIAAVVYFYARIGHFLVYTLAVPVLRVLLFLTGWACTMVMALALLD